MTRERRILRWALVAAGVALAVALFALFVLPHTAWARPGGGESFSGGGVSGGGGGGGGSHDSGLVQIAIWLIWLAIEHPTIGVPLLLIFIVFVIVRAVVKASGPKRTNWSTGQASPQRRWQPQPQAMQPQRWQPQARREPPRRQLARLVQAHDADFSLVLFEDFLYALYAKANEARGAGQLDSMSPYLSAQARAVLGHLSPGITGAQTPVVGSMRFAGVAQQGDGVQVQVLFETNYSESVRNQQGGIRQVTYYSRELWSLHRALAARSRPPQQTRNFVCPNCGAPLSAMRGSTCTYCQQQVDTGRFDWVVGNVAIQERTERGPQLTGEVAEQGTNLPTIVAHGANERLAALQARDPAFQWPPFTQRAGLVFSELQVAWSSLDWAKARPFVSDELFQMQLYWVDAYQRAGLRNVTENARITAMELADVASDRFFDAVTVRVHATGLDYVVRPQDGKVVRGSKSRERPYTEYWTLIRGSQTTGPTRLDKTCPSCGAPLKINMAGSCEHCQARVTSGTFDWVLSRIEQDETYEG